ncbi:hypothetical protein RugamoR57_03680 [Duganella caerulea]
MVMFLANTITNVVDGHGCLAACFQQERLRAPLACVIHAIANRGAQSGRIGPSIDNADGEGGRGMKRDASDEHRARTVSELQRCSSIRASLRGRMRLAGMTWPTPSDAMRAPLSN